MYLNIGDIKEKHNQENKPKQNYFQEWIRNTFGNNGELIPCVFRFQFLEWISCIIKKKILIKFYFLIPELLAP